MVAALLWSIMRRGLLMVPILVVAWYSTTKLSDDDRAAIAVRQRLDNAPTPTPDND